MHYSFSLDSEGMQNKEINASSFDQNDDSKLFNTSKMSGLLDVNGPRETEPLPEVVKEEGSSKREEQDEDPLSSAQTYA